MSGKNRFFGADIPTCRGRYTNMSGKKKGRYTNMSGKIYQHVGEKICPRWLYKAKLSKGKYLGKYPYGKEFRKEKNKK